MYIEEKALDLTVKKAPVRARSEVLLDAIAGYEMVGKKGLRGLKRKAKDSEVDTKGKGKKGKEPKGQSSVKKKVKKLKTEDDTINIEQIDDDVDGGENDDDTDVVDQDDDDDDDDDGSSSSGSQGDMSRQHSREDFLHAEMLLSLGSQGEGASREGSPKLGKKGSKKKGKKRKIMSKESFKEIKIPIKDALVKRVYKKKDSKDAYMETLSKIIKKVDRRISHSDKVIVESVETSGREEDGTALQNKWEEQLQASRKKRTAKDSKEEKGTASLSKEASEKLKEVRGITKAISEAKKDTGQSDHEEDESESNETENKMERMTDIETEKSGENKDEKPNLESLLEASMISYPHSCVICGLKYIEKDGLIAHLKTHCDYHPFKCGICLSTFEKAGFLQRTHMKIHMHDHKYVCDECGKHFTIPLQLMQHLTKHDNFNKHESSDDSESSTKQVGKSSVTISSSGLTEVDLKPEGETTDEDLEVGISEHESGTPENMSSEGVSKKAGNLESDCEQGLSKKKTYLSPFVCNLCDNSVSYGQELNSHVRLHYQEQRIVKQKVIRPNRPNSKKDHLQRFPVQMGSFQNIGHGDASSQLEEDLPKDSNEKTTETAADNEHDHGVKGEPTENESAENDGQPSILAKALQTAPRYGSNLVVDKATGLIYHITNIPESVKEYQALTLNTGMQGKPDEKELTESEIKDSNDSFNASQVVHVPVSNSSMSFPILIRKPVSSTWTLPRPKTELTSAVAGIQRKEKIAFGDLMAASKLPKVPVVDEAMTTKTRPGTKGLTMTALSNQKIKVAVTPQKTSGASHTDDIDDKSIPALGTGQDDSSKETQTNNGGTNVNMDQIPLVSRDEAGRVKDTAATHLEESKVDQFSKGSSCILEITQGGITQLVKIAVPNTVGGPASKQSHTLMGTSVLGASPQFQPISLTQSLPLPLTQLVHGAANSTTAAPSKPRQGAVLTQNVQGTTVSPTLQGTVLSQTLQGTALTQSIQGYASQLGQPGLPMQTVQKVVSNGSQQPPTILQIVQEGALGPTQTAVKHSNIAINKSVPGPILVAPVPGTQVASNSQAATHQIIMGGTTRTEPTLMPVLNGNINIPYVLQTVSLTKSSTPVPVASAALNKASTMVVSGTSSPVATLPGTNLFVLPTSKASSNDPSLGKNIPPGAWCSEILSGAFSSASNPQKLPIEANVTGAKPGTIAPFSGSVSPVLGTTPILVPGQGLYGVNKPVTQQETNKIGFVQVIPQSVPKTVATQHLMSSNMLAPQALNQMMKPQSSSPLNVVLSNDAKLSSVTTPQQVMLNVAVGGQVTTKTATLLPANLSEKQTAPTVWPGNLSGKQTLPTAIMQPKKVLLGPFVQKLSEPAIQVISPPRNPVASVAGNKLIAVPSTLNQKPLRPAMSLPAGSLVPQMKTATNSQPQFLIKVSGVGDVLYAPTQTQQFTTSVPAAKTETSNIDISKLIQNSLKSAQATAVPVTQSLTPPSPIASSMFQSPVLQTMPISVSPSATGVSSPSVTGLMQSVPALFNKTLATGTNVLSSVSTSFTSETSPTMLALSNSSVNGSLVRTLETATPTLPFNFLQGNCQTSAASSGPQIAITTCSAPTPFSIPLCVKTSTGGGIATIQVGDKVYPLSLVFYQSTGSSQATPATVSIATSSIKSPVSTVSVLSTSSTTRTSTSPGTADIVVQSLDFPVITPDEMSQDETNFSSAMSGSPSIVKAEASAISDVSISISSGNVLLSSISSTLPVTNSATTVAESASLPDNSLSTTGSCENSVISSSNSLETSADLGQSPEEDLPLCSRCSVFFSTPEMLKRHLDSHDAFREQFKKCEHCEAVFYDANQLRQHNLTHFLKVNKDPEVFVCPKCDIEFSNGIQLKYHCTWAHKKDTFACQHCDQIFLQEVALQAHSFHHPYLCQICQSRFDSRKAVEFHVMCHDNGPNKCTFCNEIFNTKAELKEHLAVCQKMQISTRYLWFCENCKCPFSSRKRLEEHIQTHYSKTVFYCGLCKRGFLDTEAAKSHLLVHEVMPLFWSCHFCGQKFASSDLASKHVESCSPDIAAEGRVEILNENVPDSQLEENSQWDADEIKSSVDYSESMNQDDTSSCGIEQKYNENAEQMGTTADMPDNETKSPGKFSRRQDLETKLLNQTEMGTHALLRGEDDTDQVKVPDGNLEPEKFECSVCGLLLKSCFRLKQHMVITHFYSRTNRNAYQNIIEKIKKPRLFICKFCKKPFRHQSTLLCHMRLRHDRDFSCKLCARKFETRAALTAHGKENHTFQEGSKDTQSGEIDTEIDIMPKVEDGEDLEHSTSEGELHIDEEKEEISITGHSEIPSMSVKERLAIKCKTGSAKPTIPSSRRDNEKERKRARILKMKSCQLKTLSKGDSALGKVKKDQRKKVFGCGLCGKSFFKLMKLTKHVWEHEQLEGQGQGQVSIATPEIEAGASFSGVAMETFVGELEKKLLEETSELIVEEQKCTDNKSELNKTEGKYMCALCKVKYQESADLFKHAKVHLDLKDIAALAKRKLKHAPLVTGDPSKPTTVYIELDNRGNLVRRIPPVTSKVKEETMGHNSDETSEGLSEGKQEPMTVVVCNLCKETVYKGPNDKTLDHAEIGNHRCAVKAENTDTNV